MGPTWQPRSCYLVHNIYIYIYNVNHKGGNTAPWRDPLPLLKWLDKLFFHVTRME